MATKTAYVTGSANIKCGMRQLRTSRGCLWYGRAVAQMLSDRGIRVAIVDANIEQAQAVADALPGSAIAVPVNAAEWESQVSAFEKVLRSFGRIDYVFANAGIGEKAWIPNDPSSTGFVKPDLAVLDVDLNGVLYTAALAIQQMRRQEPGETGFRGQIVVTASVCGFYCVPTLPIYTAAKHGLVGFVRSYGKHLPAEQITLNAVCPYVVRTGISKEDFYSAMEAEGLLVPMESVVLAFEQCLDKGISGETLEVARKNGVVSRSAPPPLDDEAEKSMTLLQARGAPLHRVGTTLG